MKWFRWHRGTCEDSKLRSIARESRVTLCDTIAAWAFILEDASHSEHRGILCNQHLMDALFDWKPGVAQNIIRQMAEHGLLNPCPDPAWEWGYTVIHWKSRQYEGDVDSTAAERQRRKRERDKSRVSHGAVTRDTVTESRPESDTESESEDKSKYGFSGTVIRVDHSLLADWKRDFPNIDVVAHLRSRDAFLQTIPENDARRGRKTWLAGTAVDLRNKNDRAKPRPKLQVVGSTFKSEPEIVKPSQAERDAQIMRWKKRGKNARVRGDDEIQEGSSSPAATEGSGVRNLLPALQAVDDSEENQAEASNQAVSDAVLVCRDAPG